MANEFQLFDGKNLSSLFKDIYENQQNKKKNISELIESLRKLIRNVGEATVIAPIIKDLIEVSVKNDDHLIKLATIAQRLAIHTQCFANCCAGFNFSCHNSLFLI